MAVVFFDGFNRALDTHYWTATNATVGGDVLTFSVSNPVTNNVRLSNIGTQSDKKLYLGVRVIYCDATDNQPFITFYNNANTAVLELRWKVSGITYPNVGIEVVQSGTAVTTYTVNSAIASVAYNQSSGTRFDIFISARVLEFEIDLNNNTLAIQYQGQSLLNTSSAALTSSLSLGNDISAVQIFGPKINGSMQLQDLYLVDDSGTFANTWLGVNFAVHGMNPQSGPFINNNWSGSPGVDGSYLSSSEPDGDQDYIRTAALNATIAYDMTNISPGGNNPVVAGIRLQSNSRRMQIDAAYKYLYYNVSTTTITEMGDRMVLTSNIYSPKPTQFINVNPETGAQWTTSQLNSNGFGFKSVDPA